MKIFIKLFLFFLIFSFKVYSKESYDININGNNRISKETVISIINFKKNNKYNLNDLNDFQKKLLESNFFKKVNIKIENKEIQIFLEENQIVDFFYIKGVQNKTREDFFYDNLSLGQNKIFSEFLLKSDIEKIKSTYYSNGYFDVDVTSSITEMPGNALNVVLSITRNEKYKINRIFFIGNKNFKSSTLYDVILSKEDGWWKFLSQSTVVDQSRINKDKDLLKDFYLNEGYYDVQIVSSDINFLDKKSADVTFSINSGDVYTYSDFIINDNDKNLNNENKEFINKIISNKLSGNFSKNNLDTINDILVEYLRNQKIDFVSVNYNIKKTEKNKLNIEFNFIKRPRQFVNLINIKGNTITEENVLRRNLLFSEGDTYLKYKVDKSIDRIKSLQIFKDIKIETLSAGNEKVDLNITVEEQPTGSVAAGIGVGSAGSAISSAITEKNLFGKGITLDGNISVGTEKISGTTNLSIPDFNNTGNTLNYSIFAISTDYTNSGYESKKIGNNFSTKYEVYEDISLTAGLGIDFDKIDTNDSASALYKSREGDYLTYKTFYSIYNDKRDSRFNPTKGHRIGFGQSLALPGSDVPYIENNIFGSYYYPIYKDYIFNVKSGFSAINSLNNDDIKLSDRKFLNSNNLRGFESYGVGPKDGTDHVGGNYSAYASFSTTVPNPIPDSWNAKSIIFLDTGNVWGVDFNDALDSNKIRSSAGLSLQWISPLGPLSITVSEALSSSDGDLKEGFSFQIGSVF